jgi:hypothetical protein
MSDVVISFPQNKLNKPRTRDRADDLAGVLVAMTFRHIVQNWEDANDLDVAALHEKVAAFLRIEFPHAGSWQ